jgi:hypothetical protein
MRHVSSGAVHRAVHVVDSNVILASLFLLQQRPRVVGRCWRRKSEAKMTFVEVELVVLPPVESLDAIVELGKEARGGLGELFCDLANEPAVGAL